MVEEKGITVDRRETIASASGRDQTEQGHGGGGEKEKREEKGPSESRQLMETKGDKTTCNQRG